jgi:hypothetical protein
MEFDGHGLLSPLLARLAGLGFEYFRNKETQVFLNPLTPEYRYGTGWRADDRQ